MTFFFAGAVAPEPPGLILSFAEALSRRVKLEAQAGQAREALRALLASRRSCR